VHSYAKCGEEKTQGRYTATGPGRTTPPCRVLPPQVWLLPV
jgi:hypothetical protein